MSNCSSDPQRPHLGIGRRVGYAMGDFGCNFSWSLISSYLMFFMTDVARINAATVGTMMLISKAWDAVNDPVIGTLADRTNSRWGRYRPWILFSCMPMLILNVLCFTTFPSWSESARTIWALATYFVLVLLYTMVNIPYSAMPAALTLKDEDRSGLASARMTGAFLAMTILSFLTIRVVNWTGQGDAARGYQTAAIIFSLVALPCFILCFLSTREVVQVEYKKTEYRKMFKALKGNTPVWLILGAFVSWGFMQGGASLRMYYFSYNAGNSLMFANVMTIQSITGMVGTLSLTWLIKRFSNKGKICMWAFIIGAAANFICFFLPITTQAGVMLYYMITVFNGYSAGLVLASLFGMTPDTTEYTAYYYGVHAAGFISAFINFAFKLGTAFCTAAAGWVMAGLGYVPNVAQTPTVLAAINFSVHIFVGLTMVAAAICMYNYKLDKKVHADLCEKLERGELAPGVVAEIGGK